MKNLDDMHNDHVSYQFNVQSKIQDIVSIASRPVNSSQRLSNHFTAVSMFDVDIPQVKFFQPEDLEIQNLSRSW